MYEELIAELRQHHCDAKEDDTQEVCEECAYDVIIADKSVPSGIASVCVCGLMNRAADAIEALEIKAETFKSAYIAEHNARIDEIKRHMPLPQTPKVEESDATPLHNCTNCYYRTYPIDYSPCRNCFFQDGNLSGWVSPSEKRRTSDGA